METQIDLTTIAGIVAATMAVVQALKVGLSATPYLSQVPIPIYALLVSSGLTWVAHDVLHMLPGSLKELVAQAAMASLVASGAWEQARSLSKPLASSSASRKSRGLIAVLLAAGLAASCASTGKSLVLADDAIHDVLAVAVAASEKANSACASGLLAPERCAAANKKLLAIVLDADRFNRAVRENSAASVPAMVAALTQLARDVGDMFPDAAQVAELRARIETALSLLRAVGGAR